MFTALKRNPGGKPPPCGAAPADEADTNAETISPPAAATDPIDLTIR
jgi:hypothetical protein